MRGHIEASKPLLVMDGRKMIFTSDIPLDGSQRIGVNGGAAQEDGSLGGREGNVCIPRDRWWGERGC